MKRIALCAAVTALFLAACGGGGDDGLTKAALVKQANAICLKYAGQAKTLGDPDLKDPAMAEAYFRRASEIAKGQLDALDKLKPGHDGKADFETLTSKFSQAVDLLGQLADAAGSQDRDAGTRLITELTPVSKSVDEAAVRLGAASCSSTAG